jgi:hypothetical protein
MPAAKDMINPSGTCELEDKNCLSSSVLFKIAGMKPFLMSSSKSPVSINPLAAKV